MQSVPTMYMNSELTLAVNIIDLAEIHATVVAGTLYYNILALAATEYKKDQS